MDQLISKQVVLTLLSNREYDQRNWGGPHNREIAKELRAVKEDIQGMPVVVSESNGTINDLVQAAHQNAIDKGWYEEPRTFGEIIALMHSELSEALEDHRNGRAPTEVWYEFEAKDGSIKKLPYNLGGEGKPCGIPSELADTVIRILDFCGYAGIDLEKAIHEKMAYNATRSRRHGGKKL